MQNKLIHSNDHLIDRIPPSLQSYLLSASFPFGAHVPTLEKFSLPISIKLTQEGITQMGIVPGEPVCFRPTSNNEFILERCPLNRRMAKLHSKQELRDARLLLEFAKESKKAARHKVKLSNE